MASPEILDFSTLLKPISDTQPTGKDLKSHPVRHAVHTGIREARDAARSAEFADQQFRLLGGPPPCQPDWRNVRDLAVQAHAPGHGEPQGASRGFLARKRRQSSPAASALPLKVSGIGR